ncbi:MAG: hypothetical protein WC692_07600 [Erythrobacter sp.]|jgi:hypothetical protein
MNRHGLSDSGFADTGVIRPLIRRIALKSAIGDARGSIEALLDLMNEHREPLRGDGATLVEQGIGLAACDQEGGVGGAAIDRREGHALREDELLEGVKLVTQLLDRIEIGIRYGLFSCASDEEANRPVGHAHRLCGGAK